MRCLSVGSCVLLLSLKCRTRCEVKCIFEIDLRIDFLSNLRQTQNAVQQMKKNCFVFNGTRRIRAEVCFGITHQSVVEEARKKNKKANLKSENEESWFFVFFLFSVLEFL